MGRLYFIQRHESDNSISGRYQSPAFLNSTLAAERLLAIVFHSLLAATEPCLLPLLHLLDFCLLRRDDRVG